MTKKLLLLLLCMIILLTLCAAAFTDTPLTRERSREKAPGGAGENSLSDGADSVRVIDVCSVNNETVCLMSDGTVKAAGWFDGMNEGVRSWTDIRSISVSYDHAVGVRADGTVVAAGDNQYGQCSVQEWRDIAAVSTCYACTLGLRSDGTVVFSGELFPLEDAQVQKMISSWENVRQIKVVAYPEARYILGLTGDGHVYASTGCDGWEKIAGLQSSGWLTLGLKTDGSVVPFGMSYPEVFADVSTWTDVTKMYAGVSRALAIRSDGTLLTAGPVHQELSAWSDIEEIFNVNVPVIGLKKDGSVLITSSTTNTLDEEDIKQISSWTDIEKISVSETHVVGLKKDGTLVFAGDNSCGQFDIT